MDRSLYGQPCVWCGGLLCHSASASGAPADAATSGTALCETFDAMFNGEGHSYVTILARGSMTVAGCKDGEKEPKKLPTPDWPYYTKAPLSPTFVEEPSLCPGEAPTVLDDLTQGWPGTCLNLRRRLLPQGRSCAVDCALNVSCPSWQELDGEDGVVQCWQGLGDACHDYAGGRTIKAAQRLMHGTYRVLKDLKGIHVKGLQYVFSGTKFGDDLDQAIQACNHTCLSLIYCQVWTFSVVSGCSIDRGDLAYPPTLSTFEVEGAAAGSVMAGEYVQKLCRAQAEMAARVTFTTTPVPPEGAGGVVFAPTAPPSTTAEHQAPPTTTLTSTTPAPHAVAPDTLPQGGEERKPGGEPADNAFLAVPILATGSLLAGLLVLCAVGTSRSHKRRRRFDALALEQGEPDSDGVLLLDAAAQPLPMGAPVPVPVPTLPVSMLVPPARAGPFAVALDRSLGGFLGIEVDYAVDGDAIIVSTVTPGGQVAAWNAAFPQSAVTPGDLIVEVNGMRTQAPAMMEQLRSLRNVSFTVMPKEMRLQ